MVISTVYVFLTEFFISAMLGLHWCSRAFSSCGSQGCYSLWCTGFSLWWLRLLRCPGSRAQAQCLWHTGFVGPSMWDPLGSEIEPTSALAGKFFTPEPPRTPFVLNLYNLLWQALLFSILQIKGREKFSNLPESHS